MFARDVIGETDLGGDPELRVQFPGSTVRHAHCARLGPLRNPPQLAQAQVERRAERPRQVRRALGPVQALSRKRSAPAAQQVNVYSHLLEPSSAPWSNFVIAFSARRNNLRRLQGLPQLHSHSPRQMVI